MRPHLSQDFFQVDIDFESLQRMLWLFKQLYQIEPWVAMKKHFLQFKIFTHYVIRKPNS